VLRLLVENRSLFPRTPFLFKKILRQDRLGAAAGKLVDMHHPPFWIVSGPSVCTRETLAAVSIAKRAN
jgi:hypothetical protein